MQRPSPARWFPDGYDVDPKTELIVTRNEEDPSALDMLSFATFLYEDEAETGPLLKIPEQFTKDE